MKTFSVPPQHQSFHQHHHHHEPVQDEPSSLSQTPSVSSASFVTTHLRHGHHHHPNNSAGNFSFPFKHLGNLTNSSLNSLSQWGQDPSGETLPSSIIPNNFTSFSNGNFTSVAAAAMTMTGEHDQNISPDLQSDDVSGGGLGLGETIGSETDFTKFVFSSESSQFNEFNLSSAVSIAEDIYNSSVNGLINSSMDASGDNNATNSTGPSVPPYIKTLYSIIVPVMIFFCVLTCLVNLVIVLSARWCRKPMSPTLYYSISLALADAYASFTLGVGLVINSLLPMVYGIKYTECLSLTIEAFRQGGVLVTVCHLLALGINHWIGIARPLHYAATMTRRTAWIVIILSWTCPILMLLIYYSSVSNEGFLSEDCNNCTFLQEQTYRAFYASCFFAPLFLLSLIYIHIFFIVRSHQTNRQRYQSCQNLRKNVKAALTTVLILGTFVIGWMPATLYSIIVCNDCMIQLPKVHWGIRFAFGITVNILIIFKTFVDPVIYAARMSDIQLSLKKMRYDFLQLFCKTCIHSLPPPENDRGLSKFNRSLYDTKSIRMSSFNSSSSRRNGAGGASANTNLINNSTGSQINHGRSTSGYNHTFHYKNQNGSTNSPNHLSSRPKSQLIHNNKKPAYEMTEMR